MRKEPVFLAKIKMIYTVSPLNITEITIVQTIKDCKTVYKL